MIGRQISRYRIVERLGSGGMGVVYKAQDTELGRYVALKFLPAEVAGDAQALERFLREARSAAALNHPHICTIYEVSGNPEEPFIAMEFLDGQTLRQRIAGQPLPEELLLDLAIQLADGLANAHDHHIVHRDIKPANIFITKNDRLKILDFGLAKVTEVGTDDQPTLVGSAQVTNAGTTVGTVSYMSPEQARAEDVDQRSDIFSAGSVLYEMVVGQVAFQGNTEAVIYNAILSLQPTPPAQINPSVSPEFVRIIAKCLEKSKDLRYQNAADLRSDLRRLKRDTESGIVRPLPSRRRGWAMKAAIGIGALVLVAAAALLVPRGSGTADAMKATDVILLTDFLNSTGDPMFDGTLKQALAVKFEESPFLNIFPEQQVRQTLAFMRRSQDEKVTLQVGREICQRQGLKAMLSSEIAPLGSQYVITMNAIDCDSGNVLARDQMQASSKEEVLKTVGDTALHMREKLGESLKSIQRMNAPIEEATTSSLEALKAFSAGEALRAKGAERDAIPLYERAVELDPSFTLAYARIGVVKNNQGDPVAADMLRKAYDLRDRVSERERLYVTAHYYRIVEKDPEKAIDTYKLWRQTYPRDYIPAVNLGNIYQNSGRLLEATQQLEEAMQLSPSPVGISNLAAAYLQLGQTDKLLNTFKVWIEKFPADGSPHAQRASYYNNVGDFDQAVTEARLAVELEPVPAHYVGLTRSYLYANKIDEAKAAAEKAVADKLETPDLHYYLYVIARYRADEAMLAREGAALKKTIEAALTGLQGGTAAMQGRLREAESHYKRALEQGTKAGYPDNVDRFRTSIASIYCLFGSPAKGMAIVNEALKGNHTRSVLNDAGITFASNGDTAAMESVLKEFAAKYPNDAFVNAVILPAVRALSAVHLKRPEEALNLLKGITPYKDLEVDYMRGLAQAQAGRHKEAIAEFQGVIDHYGWALVAAPITFQMAHLQMGRSYVALGDLPKAQQFYTTFFSFFKNPDPDLPVLRDARSEFAKLKS